MDFVKAMLFTQQVFHLECLFFCWHLRLLLFWIKSLPSVAYKFCLQKKHVTLFFSLLKMKKQLCRVSLFLFIQYSNGAILSEQSCQKRGVRKKYKKWGMAIWGFSIAGGFKPSAHYGHSFIKSIRVRRN